MANHGAAALLLIASLLVAVALSGADARFTVSHNKAAALLRGLNARRTTNVITVRRDADGGYSHDHDAAAPAPVPEQLTCNKAHGVQASDTCYDLGQGAGLTLQQFLGFNPNINCDNLFIGQWICLDATCA